MRTIIAAALCLALAGCAKSEPEIGVHDAIIAATPQSAAVYATIDNKGAADALVGIDAGGRVPISLHETSSDGGVMRMREMDRLEVPANGKLELKSGGAHGMAMGRIEAPSGEVPLTFRFERSQPISVQARLTGAGGMPMEHGQ
jgi:copper(I)-binding protein